MKSLIDQDTLNWLFRLLIIGALFIALFSIFDGTPFIIRALGNLFTMGGLLFLMDIEGGQKFKRMYWSSLAIWIIILCHSGIGFIGMGGETLKVFQTITFIIYALSLLSVPLFTHSLYLLARVAIDADSEKYWKSITKIVATYYTIPFIAFLGTFIGRALGAEVELFYGVEQASGVPVGLIQFVMRALFFFPPLLVIIGIYKLKKYSPVVAP